jgi:hypothetical protein
MDDMKPYPITLAEWNEIARLPAVRESWGLEEEEGAEILSTRVYGARFNFVAGSPGYVSELFILQGDALSERSPFVLFRDPKSGQLMVVLGMIEQ